MQDGMQAENNNGQEQELEDEKIDEAEDHISNIQINKGGDRMQSNQDQEAEQEENDENGES